MEYLTQLLKELSIIPGGVLRMFEAQHRPLTAAVVEEAAGVIADGHGHGGYGAHTRGIVDDVLAALPALGRHHILPEVEEFSSTD